MNTDPLTTNPIENLSLEIATGLLLLPLVAFAGLLFFGKKLPRHGDWFSLSAGLISFLLSLYLFILVWQQPVIHYRFNWFQLQQANQVAKVMFAGIYLDNLSVLMLVLVTFISLLVQLFSMAYMHQDSHYNRYFAFLSLFTFSMLGLIMVDNLLLLFVFWELVGFCSYLLIGFWFERPSAVQASKKAFLVNRVGDVGLLIGLFGLYSIFGTFDLLQLKAALNSLQPGQTGLNTILASPEFLTLTGIALFAGCIGKSAQFPLQVWLPDAMEGPTPVSALIHAATMVAAGIYLLAKCYAFFTPEALFLIAVIGAITALLGALAACVQFDIKKILAYSTISQLGYMVMGMGVGAHDAALFHLITHAFFKAALFLNAGIIIHAVHHALVHEGPEKAVGWDAQDIRNMGGLWKKLPYTFYSYVVAAAALVGVPFFSGFLSKDAILAGSWSWADYQSSVNGRGWYWLVPATGFLSVALTAYYMTRHFIFIFMGKVRLPFGQNFLRLHANQETSWLMIIPVIILSLLSLGIFYSSNPFSASSSWVMASLSLPVLNPDQFMLAQNLLDGIALQNHSATHLYAAGLSVVAILVGLSFAFRRFKGTLVNTAISYQLSASPPPRLSQLLYHNWYLDKLYDKLLVQPVMKIAHFCAAFDRQVIDYFIDGFSKILVVFSKIVGWFDRAVVDGIVRGLGGLAHFAGMFGKFMQNGKIQTYYIFSFLGLLLLVFYILIF